MREVILKGGDNMWLGMEYWVFQILKNESKLLSEFDSMISFCSERG